MVVPHFRRTPSQPGTTLALLSLVTQATCQMPILMETFGEQAMAAADPLRRRERPAQVFPPEHSQSAPPAVWMARGTDWDHSCPLKQSPAIRTATLHWGGA